MVGNKCVACVIVINTAIKNKNVLPKAILSNGS